MYELPSLAEVGVSVRDLPLAGIGQSMRHLLLADIVVSVKATGVPLGCHRGATGVPLGC